MASDTSRVPGLPLRSGTVFFSIVADAGKFVDNEALPPRQRAGEARPWSLEINVGGTKIYTTVATLERSS